MHVLQYREREYGSNGKVQKLYSSLKHDHGQEWVPSTRLEPSWIHNCSQACPSCSIEYLSHLCPWVSKPGWMHACMAVSGKDMWQQKESAETTVYYDMIVESSQVYVALLGKHIWQ